MSVTVEKYEHNGVAGLLVLTPFSESFNTKLRKAVPRTDWSWIEDFSGWWVRRAAFRPYVHQLLLGHFGWYDFAEDGELRRVR